MVWVSLGCVRAIRRTGTAVWRMRRRTCTRREMTAEHSGVLQCEYVARISGPLLEYLVFATYARLSLSHHGFPKQKHAQKAGRSSPGSVDHMFCSCETEGCLQLSLRLYSASVVTGYAHAGHTKRAQHELSRELTKKRSSTPP